MLRRNSIVRAARIIVGSARRPDLQGFYARMCIGCAVVVVVVIVLAISGAWQ